MVRLLQVGPCLAPSQRVRYLPRPPEGVVVDRSGPAVPGFEHALVPGQAFRFMATEIPEPPQIGDEVRQILDPAGGVQPGQGGPDICMFRIEQINGAELTGWVEWGCRILRQREAPVGVPVPDLRLLAAGNKLRQAEFPDRFQHREAEFTSRLFDCSNQALVDERRQNVHDGS